MTFIIILALTCFFIDRISKILVIVNMDILASIPIIKNFFSITYARNFGAAFGFFYGERYLFIAIAIIVVIIFTHYLKKNIKKINLLDKISSAFVIGGTLGNLFDRLIYGYVIDFLDFKIFNYDYPIFNLADSFIVIGAILLIISSVRNDIYVKNRSKRK